MAKYHTGIAAEFYVLSALHRLGLDANLTLGNRKAIDIVAQNENGATLTIDVKGLAGKTGWPVDNVKFKSSNHFLIFVCYQDQISNLSVQPSVYVLPSQQVEPLIYTAQPSGRKLVQLKMLREQAGQYENAWHLLTQVGCIDDGNNRT